MREVLLLENQEKGRQAWNACRAATSSIYCSKTECRGDRAPGAVACREATLGHLAREKEGKQLTTPIPKGGEAGGMAGVAA